ncbi:hypothetical protein [Rhizobium sp. M10]|uniref:hypothetical protein n=1 Tax=Rhizobium sp. M10 TaxID=1324586 RepID=UPI0011450BF3|nr:hypothetical protein [Rhizobium sp. M10]
MLAYKEAKAQADDTATLGLQGIGIGAELLEKGGLNNHGLKVSGKVAGGLGSSLEFKQGASDVWDKILGGKNLTPNDMVPVILPLMPLGPIAQLGIAALQNIDKVGAVVGAGVDRLDPAPDEPAYFREWEEDAKRRNAELDTRKEERYVAWEAELERLRQAPAVKPICGSLEWQYQQGSVDCVPTEPEPQDQTTSLQPGWRATSFIINNTSQPMTGQCYEVPESLEAYTKLWADDLSSSMGCAITNLSVINTTNSVFTYHCAHNAQSITSGSFEIYKTDTKIRTLRRQQNTHVGDLQEETMYERCDRPPEPDCSPAGQAAWRANNNGAPAYMCGNPL